MSNDTDSSFDFHLSPCLSMFSPCLPFQSFICMGFWSLSNSWWVMVYPGILRSRATLQEAVLILQGLELCPGWLPRSFVGSSLWLLSKGGKVLSNKCCHGKINSFRQTRMEEKHHTSSCSFFMQFIFERC